MITKKIYQASILVNQVWWDACIIEYRIFGILLMKKTLILPKKLKGEFLYSF